MKKVLLPVGAIAVFAVAWLAYTAFASDAALRKATEFCAAVQRGDDVASVRKRAQAANARVLGPNAKSEYLVVFHGFVFEKAICRVRTVGETVESTSAERPAD